MPALTPDEAVAWAQDVFRQFKLTWEPLPPLPGVVQIRGKTGAAIIDITLNPGRAIRQITIVAPAKPEYTALQVYTLATITKATHKQADTFLAQVLRSLPTKNPLLTRWGMWQIEAAISNVELIILVIKPVVT